MGWVRQSPSDGFCQPFHGGRISRGEFSGMPWNQPIGNSADIVRNSRQSMGAGLNSNQAKRLGPQAGDNQEIGLGDHIRFPAAANPSGKFRRQMVSGG